MLYFCNFICSACQSVRAHFCATVYCRYNVVDAPKLYSQAEENQLVPSSSSAAASSASEQNSTDALVVSHASINVSSGPAASLSSTTPDADNTSQPLKHSDSGIINLSSESMKSQKPPFPQFPSDEENSFVPQPFPEVIRQLEACGYELQKITSRANPEARNIRNSYYNKISSSRHFSDGALLILLNGFVFYAIKVITSCLYSFCSQRDVC
jgi:hypothetical protein